MSSQPDLTPPDLPLCVDLDGTLIRSDLLVESALALLRQHPLQALLADRFNLKIRRAAKEIPVYALVVAKGGTKLKETPAGTPFGYTVNGGTSGHRLQV